MAGGGHGDDFGAGEDESDKEMAEQAASRRWKEFDCPDCNANNPVEDSFTDEDEIQCHYCGTEYRVIVTDEGRLRLKEI